MAWTYDVTQIGTNPIYQVRFKISDTDASDPLLQDEEIQFALDTEGNVDRAAGECCEAIAKKLAKLADKKLGPLSISYKSQAEMYFKMAAELKKDALKYSVPTQKQVSNIFSKDMMNSTPCGHPYNKFESEE